VVQNCEITDGLRGTETRRPCTPVEEVKSLFDGVKVGENTLADLLKMGFGGPNTTTENVSSTWIPSRLTKRTDGGLELLDDATRACVTGSKAAYQCQLVIFSDSQKTVRGKNNIVSRVAGIKRIDVGSSWFWEAHFVIESSCTEGCTEHHLQHGVIRAKYFNWIENPPSTKKEEWNILNNEIDWKVPGL